ncbi:MAG: GntR family transcriptional regulator [Planctomycetota bacterium]
MATQSTKTRGIRAVPTKDEVYGRLKEAIVDNRLEPGTPLSEERLAAEHGLSRTPIREILQRLSRDGLVEIIRNKGAFVSRLDPRDMHELFEMREALEGFAARLAAQRIEEGKLAKLDDIFRLLKKRRQGVDAKKLSEAGQDLHAAIQAASGNRRLIQALDGIQLHSRRAFRFSMTIPQRMEISFKEHLPIVSALKRRDPDAAEAAMRAHLRSAWKSLVATLTNPYPNRPPIPS